MSKGRLVQIVVVVGAIVGVVLLANWFLSRGNSAEVGTAVAPIGAGGSAVYAAPQAENAVAPVQQSTTGAAAVVPSSGIWGCRNSSPEYKHLIHPPNWYTEYQGHICLQTADGSYIWRQPDGTEFAAVWTNEGQLYPPYTGQPGDPWLNH